MASEAGERGVGAQRGNFRTSFGGKIAVATGVGMLMLTACQETPPLQNTATTSAPAASPNQTDIPSVIEAPTTGGSSVQANTSKTQPSQPECTVGTSFDVGSGAENIAKLGEICFGVVGLTRSDANDPNSKGTPGFNFGYGQFGSDKSKNGISVTRFPGGDSVSADFNNGKNPVDGLTIVGVSL